MQVILQIHSKKMAVNRDEVNFDELARSTEDFNGAQLKAVCVEVCLLASCVSGLSQSLKLGSRDVPSHALHRVCPSHSCLCLCC